jgi:hypothetical protein
MIVRNRPTESLLRSCLVIDQAHSFSADAWGRVLTCDRQCRAVAIVDRSTDLDLAAKEIAASRAFMGGQGCYAPDFVLVNEFVRAGFLEAWSKHCTVLNHATSAIDGFSSSDNAFQLTPNVDKSLPGMSSSKPHGPCLNGLKQCSEMKGKGLQLNEITKR